jgi:hypothetical protein
MSIRQDLVQVIADAQTALDSLNGTTTVSGVIPALQVLIAQEQAAIAFTTAASTVYKTDGSRQIAVKLYTAGGQPLASPLTINLNKSGTAQLNTHYTLSPSSITFPANSADGAIQNLTFTPIPSAITAEKVATLTLNPGKLGTIARHDVSLKAGWCYVFDFTANNGGWTIRDPGEGIYSSGAWRHGSENRLVIQKAINTTLKRVELALDYTYIGGFSQILTRGADGNPVFYHNPNPGSVSNFTATWTGEQVLNETFEIHIWGHTVVRSIKLEGLGTNPFGSNNC